MKATAFIFLTIGLVLGTAYGGWIKHTSQDREIANLKKQVAELKGEAP